jgi:hypothetical protein
MWTEVARLQESLDRFVLAHFQYSHRYQSERSLVYASEIFSVTHRSHFYVKLDAKIQSACGI